MLSLQGIAMPNCLHLVDLMYRGKLVDVPNLLEFFARQSSNTPKNVQLFYHGLESTHC
jgi:hypothetical protein